MNGKAVARKRYWKRQTTSAGSTRRPKNAHRLDVVSTMEPVASQKRMHCAERSIKRQMVGRARPPCPVRKSAS